MIVMNVGLRRRGLPAGRASDRLSHETLLLVRARRVDRCRPWCCTGGVAGRGCSLAPRSGASHIGAHPGVAREAGCRYGTHRGAWPRRSAFSPGQWRCAAVGEHHPRARYGAAFRGRRHLYRPGQPRRTRGIGVGSFPARRHQVLGRQIPEQSDVQSVHHPTRLLITGLLVPWSLPALERDDSESLPASHAPPWPRGISRFQRCMLLATVRAAVHSTL